LTIFNSHRYFFLPLRFFKLYPLRVNGKTTTLTEQNHVLYHNALLDSKIIFHVCFLGLKDTFLLTIFITENVDKKLKIHEITKLFYYCYFPLILVEYAGPNLAVQQNGTLAHTATTFRTTIKDQNWRSRSTKTCKNSSETSELRVDIVFHSYQPCHILHFRTKEKRRWNRVVK
jgi:hypothetical protein